MIDILRKEVLRVLFEIVDGSLDEILLMVLLAQLVTVIQLPGSLVGRRVILNVFD